MNEVSAAQPSRRLAAIMFTDLVGYSALAHRDEALAIELLELHRAWVREILPKHGGIEIETVGDAFLIEFSGALAAVECARAIQLRFGEHNATAPDSRRMQLRIGIHLGDVEHKGGKVMGDGVNIASRIHGMAQPGGICVSEQVHQAVRNRAGMAFESLGTPKLKNIETPLELFRLAAGANAPRRRASLQLRRGLIWVIGGFSGLALGVLLWFVAARPVAADSRSVAVLPFENLSAEADSAYFTDGLHDTVIGHLARVKDLKVISRTSVMGYRGKHGNLRAIARELGVAHILEGSVQRAGGRLRVAAQLIDTSNDTHVWSNEYDRDLADVFAVQADIAQQVAAAVHARLTPQQAAEIAQVPTKSQEAYDLYLRALVIERQVDWTDEHIRAAIAALDQAVALDPQFALAYALRADLHDTMYWFGWDPTPARRDLAGRDVDTALRLAPDLAAAHAAKARYLYHGWRDYAGAMRELEVARALAPGSERIHLILGAIYRRLGRWDEALAAMERATTLDPLNASNLWEYGWTNELLGRYAEADRIYARSGQIAPSFQVAVSRADLHFHLTGDDRPLEKIADSLPPGFDPGCGPSLGRWGLHLARRQFREAAAAAEACREEYVAGDARERTPREFFAAIAWWLAGERARAQAKAEAARAKLAGLLRADEDQPATRMGLATMLLLLGQREAALAEADRALRDMPVSRDALVAASVIKNAARLHAQAGQPERALAELEQALVLPGGYSAHEARTDPALDPLRADPRFQKLIADHLPKTGA